MTDTRRLDPYVSQAVEHYRIWEQRQLACDKAYQEMNQYIRFAIHNGASSEDLADYYRLTEKIRSEFEEKRRKAGL